MVQTLQIAMPSEQLRKRLNNQRAVLRALHFGGTMRRGEISSSLNIRKSSITSIISGLLEVGLVVETEPGHMRSPLELNRSDFFVIVANITPRDVQVARVFLGGKVEAVDTFPIRRESVPQDVLAELGAAFQRLETESGKHLLGFGVTMPGFINSTDGICIKVTNLPKWENVPVTDILGKQVTRKVRLENDVRSQLWGAQWFDQLAGDAKDIIYLAIHDGVACAILSGGQQVIGQRFSAGEIGSIRAGNEGRKWPNGRTDCLEAYSSLPAMLTALRQAMPERTFESAADIAAAAQVDPEVVKVLDGAVSRIATVLAGFVAALDPQAVILGTPNPDFSGLIRPLLQQHLYEELIGMEPAGAEILIAETVEEGSLKGIAGLVIERAFHNAAVLQDTRVG